MMRNIKTLFLTLSAAALLMPMQSPASSIRQEPKTAESDSLKKGGYYKDYGKLLEGAVSDAGVFTVHRVGTDFYFEIPDSLMGRDLLIVNKISGVPQALNDASINKGMSYEEKTVRFHADTLRKKVWVTEFEPRVSSPEGDAITRSVKDNYRDAIIEYFPIEALGKGSVVVKVNKVFDGSEKSLNNVFSSIDIPAAPKKELSMIESARSFPTNVVVKSLLSTSVTEGNSTANLTVHVTSNVVLLPEKPMTARFGDNRIGYFTKPHIYYNDTQQKVEERELLNRWRLEPRPQDVDRYLRGELVEPARPIVLYIDPATPPVWVPYIIKGVEEWQVAFEQAGFKNAIIAKEVSEELMSDFDIDDVRYSVITYAASENANAMGPSVIDPRSGEIIEADIIWWHNVMSLLQAWIRVQTGAVDPQARGNTLPTELMGNAVRFVSSHELGHSLGLKHNFGASYSVPVDSLRSKTYTDANGTSSSIMDYARFNYIAQPGDGVTQLTPRIGKYDKFAIEWGYRWTGASDPREELPVLNAMLRKHENDREYWYGPHTADGIDPRSQTEDLGDDAVAAGLYGLANLKRMIPHVMDWTHEEGELKFEAGKFLNAIVGQWYQYAQHVLTNIGGIYVNDVVYGRTLDRFVPVPADHQRRCLKFLLDEVITTPEWLFDPTLWAQTYAVRPSVAGLQEYSPLYMARGLQGKVMYLLVSDDRLHRMFEAEARLGRENVFTVDEMFGKMTGNIFGKPNMRRLTVMERFTQKDYVDALILASVPTLKSAADTKSAAGEHDCRYCRMMTQAPGFEKLESVIDEAIVTVRNYASMGRISDAASARRGELREILKIVLKHQNAPDKATRNHYYDMRLRIEQALDINK